ncbi:MAG: Trm112 family protein [Gammaproteobacteria bacterium]
MIDRKLVEILRCPVSREAVAIVPKDQLRQLNAAIAAGELKHADGRPVEGPREAALVTADGARIYPVNDGIPIMLADEAIPLAGRPAETT